ncbi:sulfatase [Roseiconus nitratireducens]|uniref:Sulfatase n=1 Tax=Roseiconus nitratireducens TaxID=2605748 RepID=A0A5M6D5H8_9BACT|nr:sulfatase [Roseiconus nitratireducens]KAA5542741.1 sulfatase [Roseiconus nitratireducens]
MPTEIFRTLCHRLLCLAAVLIGSTATAADRPNVLFIFLDDFGWRDAGFMGSDFYETPHLDALAARGTVFTQAYSAAANCAPARACLLSGQYTPRHEIFNVGTQRRGNRKHGKLMHIPGTDTLRTDIRTWAQCVDQAGYRTGTIGKWHLSDDPLPYGFDFNFAGTHSGGPPQGYYPPHGKIEELADAPKDEYLTNRLTDEAIGFINQSDPAPWFLYLTHFAVHTPLQGEPDLVAKYRDKPPGELHDHAVMAAMIESVDTGVGRIVEALQQSGQSDNTIIVFTSDNGGYGPATSMSPLKGYKGTYYEGGIREPMFVVWPGVTQPGSVCEVPVINVDLYPTFCEMTGAELPDQIRDGKSLVPLLKSPDAAPESFDQRALFWHFPAYLQSYARTDQQRDVLYRSRPCSIIRAGKWKLHEYFEDGGLELYDLQADVGESNDLSETHPEIRDSLHQRLRQWRESTNAPVPTEPNPNYDEAAERQAMRKALKKRD